MNSYHLLVIMDNEELSKQIKVTLLEDGYYVDVHNNPNEVFDHDLNKYSLVIVDAHVGDTTGFKIVRTLKEHADYTKIPIVFVATKSTENERLTGFAVGADDYIVFPFSFKELSARIKVVIKRYVVRNDQTPRVIQFNQLEIDLVRLKVFLEREEIALTKREFELLKLFLSNINKVFSREEILDVVWYDDDVIQKRTIDVNINRLRNKIGDYGSHISTIPGYGYCFEN
jgi:two-component system alkaline phosphatase synthesis response regulator PhoP